ncbi:MAG: PD40 domain-containing protein [Acidobacteriota bacterium]|nr:PD40 domain-containing protein [Acidobacteriota bacterium]
MKNTLLLLLVAFFSVDGAWPQSSALPKNGVAYSVGGTLTIRSASGKTIRVIKTTPPIGTFAISPDTQRVVFAPLGAGPMFNGGPLYLLSVSTGKIRRLTHASVYNKREVYAYPDFSPDGSQVVVAIHSQLEAVPSDGDDAVTDAGPFAILNLRSGAVKKLPSTVNIGGYGPAYGASPRWSPGGQQIFVNLESDFALTSPSGEHLQDTSEWTSGDGDTFAVDWLGNGCVVYIGGKDWKAAEEQPAKVLHLSTHQTESLDKLLDVVPAQVTNLIAFSPTIRVRKLGDKLVVETNSGTWSIADAEQHPVVRVFSTWTDAQMPTTCR